MNEILKNDPNFLSGLNDLNICNHDFSKPVYKYMSIETAKIVLDKLPLRFRAPSTFNDPFEFNMDCFEQSLTIKEYKATFLKTIKRTHGFSGNEAKKALKNITISDY